MRPVPVYLQRQSARALLNTAAVATHRPLSDLVKAASTLRAIAFKAGKLGLMHTHDFRMLSARLTEIEIFERLGCK